MRSSRSSGIDGVDYLQMFEDMLAELPDLQYLVTVGDEELWYDDRIFQFEDLLSSGAGRDRCPSRRRPTTTSDLALIYTSGTMGKPKGVRLSHRAIVETAHAHRRGASRSSRPIACSRRCRSSRSSASAC